MIFEVCLIGMITQLKKKILTGHFITFEIDSILKDIILFLIVYRFNVMIKFNKMIDNFNFFMKMLRL